MKYIVVFTLGLMLSLPVVAGEKGPAVYLTGNRQVDFFGASRSATPSFDAVALRQELVEMAERKEKSPWLAAALSLVVPGAGEVYTGNYQKGALFFLLEYSSWVMAYSYDKLGDNLTVRYKNFADEHWSAERYAAWTIDHLGSLNPDDQTPRAEYYDRVFPDGYDPDEPCGPPFDCMSWAELNALERAISGASGPTGFTHTLPFYDEQQYYELIGKYEQFSRGWDDSDPGHPLENNVPMRSTSSYFFQYAKTRAQANNYYDVASTFVTVAVVNHILSAADAYWSATRYNKALHAEVRMKMQPTLYGYVPLTEAKFRYDF